jgi:CheY-like chemotaxis protein
VLESESFQIGTATDGEECLELVRKRKPDLLILDLLMPHKDGFAVIRELRAEPTYATLPIMVLTTVVEDASRRRYELETGQDMGVECYLQKPVPPDELLRSVKEVVEG